MPALAAAGYRVVTPDMRGYGQTDRPASRSLTDPYTPANLLATILHTLGFDHTKLTFRHAGRDYRLTDVAGNVVKAILA